MRESIMDNKTVRKTYITGMPDKAGAFLLASRIIARNGGNIVRVNYNKAVDTHTLFIEVSAPEAAHKEIKSQLKDCGYLDAIRTDRRVIMIVLTLEDKPGAVTPVLEVLNRYRVNISYISSQENGTPYQHFKMGLLIEDPEEISGLINEISRICDINILDYEVTDRLLDGTVFYITFANTMRHILNLDQRQTNEVLVQANKLMQILDEQNKSPIQTFDYIKRFAGFTREKKGENFKPLINFYELSQDVKICCIEPPCGSNTYILDINGQLLFVDSGFACYKEEMFGVLRGLFPGFYEKPLTAFLTHTDVDHAGLADIFGKVYMSRASSENFEAERNGQPSFRELNPAHAPYCVLSKIISGYNPPAAEKCVCVGGRKGDAPLEYIGAVNFGGYDFEFYEGNGGHVRGETVIVCRRLQLLFSGDIYVNIKGFSDEQREFNRLAPFLMTGVDSDPAKARECREYLIGRYSGYMICPGHGAPENVKISENALKWRG